MIRPAILLAVASLAACDRTPAEPRPDANAASFDNAAAGQSIMQPEVVAANPPAPASSPTPTPARSLDMTVLFPSGSALDAEATAALDRLAAVLPANARLAIRGHSDSPGSDTANLSQSRRRAGAVRDYLAAHGIAPDRMDVIALGETRPVAPNANLDGSDDPAGRARNRRVEVEVLPASEPMPSPTVSPTPG